MTSEFSLAVHALVYMCHKKTVISSRELAENICTNPARVRKVMSRLQKAGLVKSLKGKGSGYCLISENEKISLDMVLTALNELPISSNWRSGDVDMDCMVSSGMGDIMTDIYSELNECCFRSLAEIRISDIEKDIFEKEKIQKGL